jgi:putative sterol carrier protein
MKYKTQVQNLLEVITGKLRIIEAAATGTMQLPHSEILQVINDAKKVTERVSELVSIERD